MVATECLIAKGMSCMRPAGPLRNGCGITNAVQCIRLVAQKDHLTLCYRKFLARPTGSSGFFLAAADSY